MPGALEDGHVRAELGDHHSSEDAIHTGDLGETDVMFAVRSQLAVDTPVELRDVRVDLLKTRELDLQDEAMMLFDLALESELQFAELLT